MWNYTIVGKIHQMDLKVAKVNRRFKFRYLVEKDSSVWLKRKLQDAVIKELEKRSDKGYPWFGDAVEVITPTCTLTMCVPYPEEREPQMELFE